MLKHRLINLFESRQSNLDYRIKRDYIRNGVAMIPCQISDYGDVISSYSVKGYESLNQEFFDYVKSAAELTPFEYPLVLNIIGDCLTEEQKKTIAATIEDDFAYNLGSVEREERRHTKIFNFMFFGLLISGVLLWMTRLLADEPREMFFVLFWFMGDTLCDYVFLTGHDLRKDRRLAGRLASVKVVFSDRYEDKNYSEKDVDKLYSEIEKDVKGTIKEEE